MVMQNSGASLQQNQVARNSCSLQSAHKGWVLRVTFGVPVVKMRTWEEEVMEATGQAQGQNNHLACLKPQLYPKHCRCQLHTANVIPEHTEVKSTNWEALDMVEVKIIGAGEWLHGLNAAFAWWSSGFELQLYLTPKHHQEGAQKQSLEWPLSTAKCGPLTKTNRKGRESEII